MLYQTTLYIYSYVGNVEKDQVGNMLGWFVLENRRTNHFLKSKTNYFLKSKSSLLRNQNATEFTWQVSLNSGSFCNAIYLAGFQPILNHLAGSAHF